MRPTKLSVLLVSAAFIGFSQPNDANALLGSLTQATKAEQIIQIRHQLTQIDLLEEMLASLEMGEQIMAIVNELNSLQALVQSVIDMRPASFPVMRGQRPQDIISYVNALNSQKNGRLSELNGIAQRIVQSGNRNQLLFQALKVGDDAGNDLQATKASLLAQAAGSTDDLRSQSLALIELQKEEIDRLYLEEETRANQRYTTFIMTGR